MWRTYAYKDGIRLTSQPLKTWEMADKLLTSLLDYPNEAFTGGGIETHVDGFGWVLDDEPSAHDPHGSQPQSNVS